MEYTAKIKVELKTGMLDPEAITIEKALDNLGFKASGFHTARLFTFKIEADTTEDATIQADLMCKKLLANPVIHNYSIEVIR